MSRPAPTAKRCKRPAAAGPTPIPPSAPAGPSSQRWRPVPATATTVANPTTSSQQSWCRYIFSTSNIFDNGTKGGHIIRGRRGRNSFNRSRQSSDFDQTCENCIDWLGSCHWGVSSVSDQAFRCSAALAVRRPHRPSTGVESNCLRCDYLSGTNRK